MSRINIFVGHFGSGKSEVAINYAIKRAQEGVKVSLVDLDIVNPYFCSRELKYNLEEGGVRVISAPLGLMNGELMVVPPEVLSAFNDKSREVVFDIGGDGSGAAVLGVYNKYFRSEDYDMYLVVNNMRPATRDINGVKEYINEIEKASRLKINRLISNCNLRNESTINHVLVGRDFVKKLSYETSIPLSFVVCKKELYSEAKKIIKEEVFGIKIYMTLPWEK